MRPKVVFSEGGFLPPLLQNDPAGSVLRNEGKWGSSVHKSCWATLEYLLLDDFFKRERMLGRVLVLFVRL